MVSAWYLNPLWLSIAKNIHGLIFQKIIALLPFAILCMGTKLLDVDYKLLLIKGL